PAALLAVRTAAGLPQQHPVPLAALAFVVRRFHSVGVHEGPQPGLVAQQLLAGSCRLGATALGPALQGPLARFAYGLYGLLQTLPRQLARPEPVPQMKQPVALLQQDLSDDLARLASVNHRLEVPSQMGPTPLQPLNPPIRL